MKITAKEILADKGNIYKNMSEKELNLIIVHRMKQPEYGILFDKFKCDTSIQVAHKLWIKWHYRDGRHKPIRVRHRCERKELDKANKNLESAMCDVIELQSALTKYVASSERYESRYSECLEKLRNYQIETSQKNIQIINLQGEVSKAHNTTKIVAFVSLVIIIGLILIPYLN